MTLREQIRAKAFYHECDQGGGRYIVLLDDVDAILAESNSYADTRGTYAEPVKWVLSEGGWPVPEETAGNALKVAGLGTCHKVAGCAHEGYDKPHVRNDACWNWKPI